MSQSEYDAARCLARLLSFEDCEERQVGDVSNRFVKFNTERRTFKILRNTPFSRFPCACCDGDSETFEVDPNDFYLRHYIRVCQGCQAPICSNCVDFISDCSLAQKIKRCRWCSSQVHPPCEHDLHAPPNVDLLQLLLDICKARVDFQAFINWKVRVFQRNLYFDFSKIFWAAYFDRSGWQFFANAKNFFEIKLRLECELVFARMSCCFNTDPSRKRFAGLYYRFQQNEINFLFPQTRNVMLMDTFAFQMLKRMSIHRFQVFVLGRLRAIFAKKLSDGLGIF
jgi:hypothetical protein